MTPRRDVWFTDRYGAEQGGDVSIARLSRLLDSIELDDGDDEHRSISVTDEHEWNLEFSPGRVLFENVGDGGGEVGHLSGLPRAELLALAEEFIRGDFDRLRARPWGQQG